MACTVLGIFLLDWRTENPKLDDAVYLINIERYADAAHELRQIAPQSYPAAMMLGELYATGFLPDADLVQAKHWFALADKLRKEPGRAAYGMGWEYLHGPLGLAPDYKQARFWFEEAARSGHGNANALAKAIAAWSHDSPDGQPPRQ